MNGQIPSFISNCTILIILNFRTEDMPIYIGIRSLNDSTTTEVTISPDPAESGTI